MQSQRNHVVRSSIAVASDSRHMQEIQSARHSQTKFIGLILLLILSLGTVVRLVNLGSDSIWLDEAYSIQFARLPVPQLLAETAASDVHPPLYYLLLHYWIKLFSDREAGVRLLSALFGILAILMIYLFAALLFNRATALLSALLLALSLFHIEFAQEARMYTLLALLALCSLYFFLKLFAEARAPSIVGYVISTSLLMHTHVYGFFIIIAENLFFFSLFLSRREAFKRLLVRWLLMQAALVVLFLPWLSIMLRQFERVQRGFWIPRPTLNFLRLTWTLYAGGPALLSLLFIPLVALGLVPERLRRDNNHYQDGDGTEHSTEEQATTTSSSSRASAAWKFRLNGRQKILLLLLWLLSSIALPFVISQFSSSIYLPKYTIAASPAFLILAARGIMSIRADRVRVLLLGLVLALTFVGLRAYWSAPHKDFWRESASYFDRTAQSGDLVLFHQESGQVPFRYYSRRTDAKWLPLPPDDKTQLSAGNIDLVLKETTAGHNRVWLVVSHPLETTTLITKQMSEWYKVTEHRVDPGVELYLFEKGTVPQ